MHVLDEFGQEIFNDRYTLFPGESWEEACKRVATSVSMVERYDDIKGVRDDFYSILLDNYFMPAGRIWAAAGRPRGNMLNCYVLPTGDSREEWGQAIKDTIIVTGMGGGIGINCSSIRPSGDPIKGTGGQAGGPLAFMEVVNSLGEVIQASGGRRMALMLALEINHPNVEDFIQAKIKEHKLNNANISVIVPQNGPGEEFFKAVKRDKEYPLVWKDRVRKLVKAKDLWNTIVDHAITKAEPGILNFHLANQMNNIGYAKKLVCTNPCGEICLEPYGACDLGSLVLPRFVENGNFNWNKFSSTIKTAVRFLDNVLDATNYPLAEIDNNVKQVRRLGLGITGLHDCLLLMGLDYDERGIDFVEKLMEFLRDESYKASADLAGLKGVFPLYNHSRFMESNFVSGLSPYIKGLITQKGMRNCALLTIAPTGTTSIICGTSSGVEPIFSLGFQRIVRKGKSSHKRMVVHPLIQRLIDEQKDVSTIKTTHDVPVRLHLEMQKVCQKYVDNSIAKTINLPRSVLKSKDEQQHINELLFEYMPYLKGVTLYTDGSRGEAPIQSVSVDDLIKANCPNGACTL